MVVLSNSIGATRYLRSDARGRPSAIKRLVKLSFLTPQARPDVCQAARLCCVVGSRRGPAMGAWDLSQAAAVTGMRKRISSIDSI